MINVRELLRLSSVPRIGPQKIRALVAHFKTPDEVFRASARELITVPGIDKKLATNILHHTAEEKFADEQLKRLNKLGGRIVKNIRISFVKFTIRQHFFLFSGN
jgi:ERCC4-type nuclease